MFFLPHKVKFHVSGQAIEKVLIEDHFEFAWEISGQQESPELKRIIHKWMEAYFSGKKAPTDLPINLKSFSAFTQVVWKALCKIPFGETITYKELAKATGSPHAARAVGNACGKNPCLLVIPCHRVIASDGSLGGFSAGLHIKKTLLAFESGRNEK